MRGFLWLLPVCKMYDNLLGLGYGMSVRSRTSDERNCYLGRGSRDLASYLVKVQHRYLHLVDPQVVYDSSVSGSHTDPLVSRLHQVVRALQSTTSDHMSDPQAIEVLVWIWSSSNAPSTAGPRTFASYRAKLGKCAT